MKDSNVKSVLINSERMKKLCLDNLESSIQYASFAYRSCEGEESEYWAKVFERLSDIWWMVSTKVETYEDPRENYNSYDET